MSDERYDFTLFGATGFTGQEALRHLLTKPADTLGRWAIAGRDRARLTALLERMAPGRDDIGILVADSSAASAMDALAAQTRVLIHLAGPYARHGDHAIRACVAHGTHYIDLTGEIPWVRRMVRDHHESAAQKKIKLVFTAGYEALPFDLLTLLAVRTMRERHGVDCRRVDVVADTEVPEGTGAGDMLSGGTVNTMRESLRTGPEEGMDDPAALIGDEAEARAIRERSPVEVTPWYDEELGGYIGPVFPAPFINPPIVQRSAHLFAAAGEPYGTAFVYREGTKVGPSFQHRLASEAMCLSIRALSGVLSGGSWLRQAVLGIVERIGPQSGEGPSEKALAEIRYSMTARALGSDGEEVRVTLRASGHPGYRSTARMIVESGLALAFDEARLPAIHGAVTPATGVGLAVLERLREAEIDIAVEGESVATQRAAAAV